MKTLNSKLFFIFLWGVVIPLLSISQPDWTRVLQTSTYGIQSAFRADADYNNIVVAGSISGPATLDGMDLTSVGMRDLILVKTNHSGITEWIRQFDAKVGGSIFPNAIKIDNNGNIFLSATFSGTANLGNNTINSSATINAFTAKFNHAGYCIWATGFLSAGTGKCQLDVDTDGNSYLISNSNKLIKFSGLGEKIWEQSYASGTLLSLAVKGTNLFLSGTLQIGTTNFGSINSTVTRPTGFLIKGSLTGDFLNPLVINGSSTGMGSTICDIRFDYNGDLVMAGAYSKDLVLGDNTISNATTNSYNFLAKCDENFAFKWIKSSYAIGLNVLSSLSTFQLFIDQSNNIYEYFGYTQMNGTYTFDKIQITGNSIAEFDTNGNSSESCDSDLGISYSSFRAIVTPFGRILALGTVGSEDSVLFNNLFIKQYTIGMALVWQEISTKNKTGSVRIDYVTKDQDGNLFSKANVQGYCDFFGSVSNSAESITLISKHDAFGKIEWSAPILNSISPSGSYPFGPTFITDQLNGILTIGKFSKYTNIENEILVNDDALDDGYVARYNNDGTLSWITQLNSQGNLNIYGISTDKDGNTIVSGEFQKTLSVNNITIDAEALDGVFLLKLNREGQVAWLKGFPIGETVYVAMVSTDGSNNIYMAGEMYNYSTQTISFGEVSTPQTSNDGGTVLVKFSPEGTPLWVRTYGGVAGASNPDSWPCDIKTDGNGNSYLWGWCPNNATFGSTTLTNPIGKTYSYYLTKINTSGNVEWANAVYETRYGYNYGDLLDLDKAGNIYVGGHFKDVIRIGNNSYAPEGTNDFFAAKYSNSGEFQWIKTIPADADIVKSLTVIKDDVVTIGGNAGKNSTLGTFAIDKKGGSSCIIATMGDLPYLNLSAKSIFLGAEVDNSNAINITSNTDWTIVADQDWVTVDNLSGSGNKTIRISAVANQNSNARNAILKIKGSGIPEKAISISQNGHIASHSHFTPVWTGNGVDHMNINIYSLTLDGIELSGGDEIGIFDGTQCVGVGIITGTITKTNTLQIIVSGNDGSGNGYIEGNLITYRFYDESTNQEIQNIVPSYITELGIDSDGKFSIDGTSFVSLVRHSTVPQTVSLSAGWNIISASVKPSATDMKALFQPLIDGGKLKKVMDEAGKTIENFGVFGGWKNNIGNWQPTEGYKVNVTAATVLTLEGQPIAMPFDIPLNTGWNIISYPAGLSQDAKAAFQSLIDAGKLKKLMDESGKTLENFGVFGGWKNNIGSLTAGKGYKVNVTGSCTLTITEGGTKAATIVPEVLASTRFKPVYTGNGTDHMTINLVELAASGIESGDELGVFDGSVCVGSAKVGADQLTGDYLSISVSASDGLSAELANGFIEGHRVTMRLYRGGKEQEANLEILSSSQPLFAKGESMFVRMKAAQTTGTDPLAQFDEMSVKCYPNPFSEQVTIEIQLRNPQYLDVKVYDTVGRLIKMLYKGESGETQKLTWDGRNEAGARVSSGIYHISVNEGISKIIFKN